MVTVVGTVVSTVAGTVAGTVVGRGPNVVLMLLLFVLLLELF